MSNLSFLHPILVHFPIALLLVYSLLESIRFRNVETKKVLLYLGTLGAFAAALVAPKGGYAGLKFFHVLLAATTIIIFSTLSLCYLKNWQKPQILIPLALLGAATIVLTGGFGGAMVYGTHFDPMMAPIFKLLGVY